MGRGHQPMFLANIWGKMKGECQVCIPGMGMVGKGKGEIKWQVARTESLILHLG